MLIERYLQHPHHIEIQVLADEHKNAVYLGARDCSMQRRNQKVVERAPAVFLDAAARAELCTAALAIGRAVSYVNAGTVEFLVDAQSYGKIQGKPFKQSEIEDKIEELLG